MLTLLEKQYLNNFNPNTSQDDLNKLNIIIKGWIYE